jgi:hypothetical protein
MKKVHLLATFAVALVVMAGVWFPVAGQERGREDVLSALLVEVRGLRGAIEHMASASARVQLITSRLQLQEQRLNTLIPRLAEQRDRLAAAAQKLASAQAQLLDAEGLPRESDPHKRAASEQWIAELKRQIAESTPEVQRVRTDEAEIANLVSTKQSRWAAINKQLEELEALLRR